MADKTAGQLLIPESDYVTVVDGDGNELGHKVPKAWVGTDLLPKGYKAKASASSSDDNSGVPAKSSTREVLDAYATSTAGLTEDEAKAFSTKDELHAELVKRASASE